jgi:hypothetical protein
MESRELQGWYEDPFRLHGARYFSAGHPTKLVRDGNVESYDEPPGGGQPESGTVASWDHAVSGTLKGAEVKGPNPPDDDVLAHAGRRSRGGMLAVATVVAVAGVVTGVVIASRPGPASVSMSPAAFVTQSAQRTLSARTADVTMSGSVSALGESVPVSGTGQTDFSTNAMTLNSTFNSSGHSVVEKEIETKGNLYITMSVDGQSGDKWVETPLQESGSANLGDSNPAMSLAVLAQHGNTVRTLGTKAIDGVTCSGYSVTPSRQAMIAAVQRELAAQGRNDASASTVLQTIGSMLQPTITVWFDAQGLLRQMSMQFGMQLQQGTSNGSFGADMDVTFSNYGTPVRISAPPPSDTVSSSSLLKGLGSGS